MTPLDHYLRAFPDRCSGCGSHVETQGCKCPGSDYAFFAEVLAKHVRADGTLHQNDVREVLRHTRLKSSQVARFYQIAQAPGAGRLLERTGGYEDSTDTRGKNRAKVIPVYAWLGKTPARTKEGAR
ncbi:MAG: hypothetical protein FWD95_01960 [Nocardioidaceae bacterium]|nr:hypothetical protein [Nocardioidaceae bacterium]